MSSIALTFEKRPLSGPGLLLILLLNVVVLVACGDGKVPEEAKPSPGATLDGGASEKASPGETIDNATVEKASPGETLGDGDALQPSSPASMVLISIDTLRSDHVGAYGGDVATPHLDALAAQGVLFERAYSHVPMTLPSHVSLLTGLLPTRHGVRDNIGYRPATESLPYVPERLQAAGYATAAAVSAYVLKGEGGLARGFDVYDDALTSPQAERGRRGAGGVQRSGRKTLETLGPWLAQRHDGRPFFLFVHLFEPHTPYEPPAPFDRTYGAASYAGEVAAADALVGELVAELRRLGLYDATAILVLSDHGEGLGDHGEEEHGLLLYRESLQVPLILKLPTTLASTVSPAVGRRVSQPVGLVDVAPTLLRLATLTPDEDLDGISLLEVMAGRQRQPVYGETFYPRLHFGWSELTSLVAGPHHFIQGPRAELYDLLQDGAETKNLLSTERRLAASLRDQLAARGRDASPPGAIPEEDRRALAALGYVGGHVGDGSGGEGEGPRPHPKDQLATVQELKTCLRLYQEGQMAAAETSCRRATQLHPEALDAWEHLARALLEQGRRSDALVALQRSLELAQGRASHLAVAAASLLLEARRPAAALELLQREIILSPDAWSLRLYEARTLASTGHMDVALERAQELLAERPEDADAVYLRGALRIGSGDLAAAETDLRRALERAPHHTAALSDLATLLAHGGRHGEAAEVYRRLLQLRPGDPAAVEGLKRAEALAGGGAAR